MANFTINASTHALAQNTEYSVAQSANFNASSPKTTTGHVMVWLDLRTAVGGGAGPVAGDTIQLRVYRSIAGGTLTADPDVVTLPLGGFWSRNVGLVGGNWDITVTLTTASGRTIGFEVVQDTNDVNANTVTAGAISSATFAAGAITSTVLAANSIGASQLASDAVTEVVNGVWDEVLTGAAHNVNNSAGKRLRQLNAVAIRSDIAQGGGNGFNQIQLDAGASSVDGIYDKNLIVLTAGPGAGQSRVILRYEGATRLATVERNWRAGQVPTSATEFQIFGAAYLDSITEGLAATGTANAITLDPGSPAIDDVLVESTITLCSGTGEGQSRRIVGYVGATHVATVSPAWSVTPDATTGYVVLADSVLSPATLAPIAASLAAVQSDTDNIQTRIPAALDGNGNMKAGVQTIAVNAITAAATASDFLTALAAAVWGLVSEGTETVLHQIRLLRAREVGKATVQDGDGTYTFRDALDSKNRLVMTKTGTARNTTTADGT